MRFAKPSWTNSLGKKVFAAYVASMLLSVATMVLLIDGLLAFRGPVFVNKDISEYAELLASNLRFDEQGRPVGHDFEEHERHWMYLSLKDDLAYRVLDPKGRVVLESPGDGDFWAQAGASSAHLRPGSFEFRNGELRILAATERVEHRGQTWFLQFAASARLAELFRLEIALPFMGIGITMFSLILLVLFSLLTHLALKKVLKPLHEVSASAAAISPRSMHARLQTAGVPMEIAPLVDSFNRVLERLEQGYRVQQDFLATAAHELKTPLALIRAQIEFMPADSSRDALLLDLAHMSRQVQQLLLLAEASELQNYSLAATDVGELAQEAAAYLQRMAQAAEVRIELAGADTATLWQADRGALFTLLKNLLENAIQHAPAGSTVRIELGPRALSVRDQGPGVSAEQREKLFLRFWRGAHRRDHGAGLGLAICLEIAQAHGWALSADNANPGLRLLLTQR